MNEEQIKFEDLNLDEEILKAISDIGFVKPSPIQEKAIPHVLEKKDVIGLAQTGTGKTSAFGLPTLSYIEPNKKVQSLIICPTRELAKQIEVEYNKFLKYKKNISSVCVYGGEDRYIQKKKINSKRPEVIIGTPGRIKDFISSGVIKLKEITNVILDEADEMLNMGFIDDIREILENVPTNRQTLLFSATMPKEILKITKDFQNEPILVEIERKTKVNENIEQTYYVIKNNQKDDLTIRLLDYYMPKSCIIFCNTKRQVDELVSALKIDGKRAEGLHGDLKQQQRDRVMNSFKNKSTSILIATDVAARGIDVSNVGYVINYDLPQDNESYVHRIGRTGRAGNKGVSITYVSPKDSRRLREIENVTKSKMSLMKPPKTREINRNRYLGFIEEIKGSLLDHNELTEKFVLKLKESFNSEEEMIVAFSNYYLNTTTKKYNNISELSLNNNKKSGMRNGGSSSKSNKTGLRKDEVRLKTSIRRGNRVTPKTIVDFMSKDTGIPKSAFGDINIENNRTYINVKKRYANNAVNKKDGKKFNNSKVTVSID